MDAHQVKPEVQALINSAANADEKGDYFDAYMLYLRAVEYISHRLQMDSSRNVTENAQLKQKLLSFAKDSMERAQTILAMLLQPPPLDHTQQGSLTHHAHQSPPFDHTQQASPFYHPQQAPPPNHPQQAPPPNHPQQAPPTYHPQQAPPTYHPQQAPPTYHPQQAPPPNHSQQAPPTYHPQQAPPTYHPQYSASSSLTDSGSIPSGPSPGATQPLASPTHSQLSPVQRAKERNRQLMALYQEKLQRSLQRGGAGTQRMTLSTLRRLEENLSIAKAKEQSLRLKARRLLKLKQAQLLDSTSAVGRAKSDPDTLAREVSSYERLRARYLKLRARLLRPPVNPKTVLALLNEALKDKNHPLYMEFGKLQYPILLQLQPLLKDLDQFRFLPWIGSESGRTTETEGPSVGPEVFRMSSHSPTPVLGQPQSPSASVEEEGEGAVNRDTITGADDAFEDKLAALKASLLSQPTTLQDSSSVEGDISESQLLHDLGAASDSSAPEFQFLLRPPSPVATEDLSASDMKEVFGETTGEHVSGPMGDGTGIATDVSTGSSLGGATSNSRASSTGGDSMGSSVGGSVDDEGRNCAFSSLAACSVVRQPQCGQLHVSVEQEQMVALQGYSMEHLPRIVNELQAALGTLIHAILTAYKIPDEEQSNIREAIEPVVEQAFFPPLWPHLVKAFRLKHYDGEVALATNMALLYMCVPEDLDVREKFCLRKEPSVVYGSVIDDLVKMMSLSCPSDKLAMLVHASKSVFQCIEVYYREFEVGPCPKQSSMGVDDLLPIICYITMRTGLPQILSELAALQEFISDSYLMGEDGFCLTTFCTAVEYLKAMSPDSTQLA